MTLRENEEIKKKVQELLEKGLIKKKKMIRYVVLVVLSLNKDRGWRMCIESRNINKITIKFRFPLSRIDDIMDYLSCVKHFSKIDLKSGHNQIKMREGDE